MSKETEQVVVTDIKTIVFCDRCSDEVKTRYAKKQCYICGMDVCWNCGDFFDPTCSLEKPSFYVDYPEVVCNVCWISGEAHRKEIMRIRKEADVLESSEFKTWKGECSVENTGV